MIRLISALLVAFALWCGGAVAAQAQEVATSPGPASEEWLLLAERAEESAARDNASAFAISRFRAQLVVWRDVFLQQTEVNAARLATISTQLAALGPVPEDGAEPEAVAARRAALLAQQAALLAPQILAKEAYARANGLISEFDATLLVQQTAALTTRSAAPILPENLTGGIEASWSLAQLLWAETTAGLVAQWQSGALLRGLPRVIGLLVLAVALLGYGRTAVTFWRARIAGQDRQMRRLWLFGLSLFQIIVPLLGLWALSAALRALGIFGLRGTAVIEALPLAGVLVVAAWWLGRHMFPTGKDGVLEVADDDTTRALHQKARLLIVSIGWVMGFGALIEDSLRTVEVTPEVLGAAEFPLYLALAALLFALSGVIRAEAEAARTKNPAFGSIMTLVGRLSAVVAIGSPVAMAFGYLGAGAGLLVPTILSLGLLALVAILQGLFKGLMGESEEMSLEKGLRALLPVMISFVLGLVSLPFFALIWGADEAALLEFWTRIKEGLVIGETRISPADFLTFVVVFTVAYLVTRTIQSALRRSVLPRTRLDHGAQNAAVAGVGYVGIFLSALIAITSAGLDLSNLAIVAGALSVGIGFGLQNIVSNFVSGIILLIERPISEGDWIEVGGQMGYVRAISVRSTRIETFDRTDVIIPNSDLVSGQVTNWTRGNSVGRVIVPVGVAYGTNVEKVTDILLDIARAHPMVMEDVPPSVVFQGFGADSLDFEIRAILRDVNYVLQTKSEMNYAIVKRFAEEGIEIPFAQRDIWLRNPEVLRGA